jgi:hypothetical protein
MKRSAIAIEQAEGNIRRTFPTCRDVSQPAGHSAKYGPRFSQPFVSISMAWWKTVNRFPTPQRS